GSPFHVDDHLALEPHQAGMGQIKRNGDARRDVGAEPFVGDPGMRPDAQSAPAELVVEIGEPLLEPRPFDGDLEILEAKLQQLVVGQRGPGKLARHGVPELGKSAGGGWVRGPKSSSPRRRFQARLAWARASLGRGAGGGGSERGGPGGSPRSGQEYWPKSVPIRAKGNAESPYSAASRTAPIRSTRAAQNLNSGILPNGSSAG